MAIKINNTPATTLPQYPEAFKAGTAAIKAIGAAVANKSYAFDVSEAKRLVDEALVQHPNEFFLLGIKEVLNTYT